MGSLMYFLTPEQREKALLAHLADKDAKKAPRVAIISHLGLETDTEMMHADREVVDLLANELRLVAQAYSEKVEIIPSRKVEEYKSMHPNWKIEMKETGRKLLADQVVYLEFRTLSMREPKLINMFKGRADITIHVFDVNTDEMPLRQTFSYSFPESRAGDPIDADVNTDMWRSMFLKKVAVKLMPYFINHPRQGQYQVGE
jgi:hypothetical protein